MLSGRRERPEVDPRDRGGTGRRAGLRILWGNPWGFESLRSHPKSARMTTRTAWHLPGACLLGATLVACHSTAREDAFLATRVPVARLDSVLRAADSLRLPLADARALLEVARSEEHTSELQSHSDLVCRLLL